MARSLHDTAPPPARPAGGWAPVCRRDQVPPGGGVAALVDGRQVAVFRTDDDRLYALDNLDPFTGAQVLSRGIVGDHDGVATVASPLRKQRFALATGACLDGDVAVATWAVRDRDGIVAVAPVANDHPETDP